MNANFIHYWQPYSAFSPPTSHHITNKSIALFILNQPISTSNDEKLLHLIHHAAVCFCVDGGMNQLFNWQQRILAKTHLNKDILAKIQLFFPDYICGDLDSADPGIRDHYQQMGTKLFHLHNQDLNDFDKTLRFAINCINKGQVDPELIINSDQENNRFSLTQVDVANLVTVNFDRIVAVCDFGGRVDHCIANLNSLYNKCLDQVKTFILSSESVTCLLKTGVNVIYVDDEFLRGVYCGYFSLGGTAVVTSYGLKWDVKAKSVLLGSFVSSSNEFSGRVTDEERKFIGDRNLRVDLDRMHVIIETDQELIWTMSIK